MTKTKDKKLKFTKPRIIIFSIILIILLSTIFFANNIELYVNYKTNNFYTNMESSLKVHYIDVGQGDCSVIELPDGKVFLIDAGTEESKENIVNYLNTFVLKDSNKIDYFLLTHPHDDHIGGANFIFDNYEVETILRPKVYSNSESVLKEYGDLPVQDTKIYENVISAIKKETFNNCPSNVYFSSAFFKIETEMYKIEFLSPNENSYNNLNNYSPIILLTANNNKFLFTGDAEDEIEREVLNSYSGFLEYLDVDVIKIGHHGSNTSSTSEFLNIVKPEYAVISVGKNNEYNNPSNEVLTRIEESGVNKNNIKRTDLLGNILFTINTSNEIECYNINSQVFPFYIKYWHILIFALLLDLCIFIIPNKSEEDEN